MAEQRKKTNQKQNGKQPVKGTAQKKKRPTKAQLEQLRIEEEIRRAEQLKKRNQTISLIIFAVSLVFFSIVLIPAGVGTVWNAIRGFMFGLFGWSAFILPCVLIYIAIMMTMEKLKTSISIKLAESIILVLFISALMYVFSYQGAFEFGKDVLAQFRLYSDYGKIGWGIFGALIGEALMLIGTSKGPAVAILLVSIFLMIMFLTNFTLVRLITGIATPARKMGDKIEKARQELQKDAEAQEDDDYYGLDEDYEEEEESPEEKPAKKKKRFAVFGEDDLLSEEDVPSEEITEEAHEAEEIPVPEAEEQEENEEDEEAPVTDIFAMAAEKQAEQEEKKLSQKELDEEQNKFASEVEKEKIPDEANYILPPLSCLRMPVRNTQTASKEALKATADKLIDALNSFNVSASVVDVVPGPSVTRYELAPAPGVKISKFTGLADDLTLHLAAPAGIRIEAPIPNKSAIGVEVPNSNRTTVTMREIVDSDIYRGAKSKLNVALGKDIAGNVVCVDLAKMPHLLVAGTTGSGKSVCLNSMIVSILYNAKPSEVKIILIDPKAVEFANYNGIPHLLVPVISDARKAAGALGWAVTEMINRYNTFTTNGVRDIGTYNKLCEKDESLQKMPQIVIIIDELSDLMSVAPSEVEGSITRLAQMARAAGMHLVVATQRPSVDVITGLIKANIPSRIALSVSSQVDSRTILDASGAEKLLGNGDMLFNPIGKTKPQRVQGCYLSDEEIQSVVEFVKTQETTSYSDDIQQEIDKQALAAAPKKGKDSEGGGQVSDADNEIIMKAAELVIDNPDKASISSLQRHLSLGFAKAGRIMDALEDKGIVGPSQGSKPRKVLMTKAQWYEMNAMAPSTPDSADGETDDE